MVYFARLIDIRSILIRLHPPLRDKQLQNSPSGSYPKTTVAIFDKAFFTGLTVTLKRSKSVPPGFPAHRPS